MDRSVKTTQAVTSWNDSHQQNVTRLQGNEDGYKSLELSIPTDSTESQPEDIRLPGMSLPGIQHGEMTSNSPEAQLFPVTEKENKQKSTIDVHNQVLVLQDTNPLPFRDEKAISSDVLIFIFFTVLLLSALVGLVIIKILVLSCSTFRKVIILGELSDNVEMQ